MKHFLKIFLPTLCLVVLATQVRAQNIMLDFTNRKLSADKTSWTFDVMAMGEPATYGGFDNGNWQAYNIRFDIDLPENATDTVKITGGTGLGDPAFTTGLVGVQTIVPGIPPNDGFREFGLTLSRTNQTDLNTTNFVHLGTFTLNFSGTPELLSQITQDIAISPRPNPTPQGSSWTNLAAATRRPFIMPSSFPLPVKLIDFSAAREGNTATLSWSTSEEINSKAFEVERSLDGKVWTTVKSVPAKGESSVIAYYSAVDDSPQEGNNLYRLKMIDKDGTSALSKIRNVEFDLKSEYLLYPNPAEDMINLKSVADWKQVSKIQMFNAIGVEVYTSPFNPSKEISVKNLASGTYVVKLTRNNNRVSNYKVVIAR